MAIALQWPARLLRLTGEVVALSRRKCRFDSGRGHSFKIFGISFDGCTIADSPNGRAPGSDPDSGGSNPPSAVYRAIAKR